MPETQKGPTWYDMPAPGSPQAIEAGCCCPIVDNEHGYGAGGPDRNGESFYAVSSGCALHWERAAKLYEEYQRDERDDGEDRP